MSGIAVKWCEAVAVFASGMDRLVHPHVQDPQARKRQGRLIGALLCGLGLFSLSLCVLLPGSSAGLSGMVALVATGMLAVLSLLCVAARGPERVAGWLALAAGAVGAGGACLLGGGLSSPLAIGLAALAIEAWMVGRERGALIAGVCAASLAGAGAFWLSDGIAANPAAWLPVAGWGLMLGARLARDGGSAVRPDAQPGALDAEAVVLRFEPGGEVADASPSTKAVLGLAPELLLGGGLFERLHVGDRVGFLCAIGDMKHGAERRRVEVRLRLPRAASEDRVLFHSFCLHLARTTEATAPFAGVLRDNTQVQELRDALDAARGAAAETAAERTQLLATLGHELRTPLNAILGFSGVLGAPSLRGLRDERRTEYAELIRGCGEHMLAVLDSMLDVGRLRAGARAIDPVRFDLGEAAQTCKAMVGSLADAKGVSLRLEADARCGDVCADKRVVQQILVNLISNSVKFTQSGGRVWVGLEAGGGQIRLSVSDTGIGIATGDLPSLGSRWTRFEASAAGKPDGAGLGLALVKELAALHGGTVSVESVRNKGTAVHVVLPDASQDGTVQPCQTAFISSVPGEGLRHGGFRKTA